MSDRITQADVDRIAESVSQGMSGYRVEAQGRNGYIGLDLFRVGDGMIDTLHVGTKREVYTYLQGMRRLQLLAEQAYHGAF